MPDNATATSADGSVEAHFMPGAGMLCCSLTCDGREILDEGRGVEAYRDRGATMGIPLLYPWANRLAAFSYTAAGRAVTLPRDSGLVATDPNGLPIHGLLPRLMTWRVSSTAAGSDRAVSAGSHRGGSGRGGQGVSGAGVAATLRWDHEPLLSAFPFPHEVRYEALAGTRELTITVTVRALAGAEVPVSFGFHPYLRLPGSERGEWRVEMPPCMHLQLDERMLPTGRRSEWLERSFTLVDRSFDDAFDGLHAPARFSVEDDAQRISVELLEGFASAQVYAPPGRQFICFEPMCAPTNALASGDGLIVLAPGDEHRARFRIALSPTQA